MGKSIKRNYVYNMTYNVLHVITPLITAPYISRVLEADGVGIVSYVTSIVTYFGLLAALGTGSFGSREIAYCRDDIDKRSTIFWENLLLRGICNLISVILYFAMIFLLVKENKIIYTIFSLNLLCTMLDVRWYFEGLEEFGKIILRNIIVRVVEVISVFVFVKTKSDLPIYVFIYSFFGTLGVASMWVYVPAYVKKPDFKSLRPFRHMKTVISLFLPSVAIQIYTVLDKSMLGWLTEGSFENGYYEQSMKISKIVLALVTSLAGVMIPRIGYLFGKNDREQISFYMYRSCNFVWCFSVALCFGLIGVSDNFVPWFFGPGYDKVVGLLKISSFLIIAIGFNNAIGVQYLIPTRRQNLFTYSVILGAVSNFIMNIILIRKYQSYGAMSASVAAETLITLVQFWMVRGELSITRIITSGRNYLIAGGIMLSILVFMSGEMTSSPVNTFTMVFTGAAVYFLSLVILRDKFFLEYSAKPIEFIRRKLHQRGA